MKFFKVMRIQFGLLFFVLMNSHLLSAANFRGSDADSNFGSFKQGPRRKEANIHFSLSYGSGGFDTRTGILSAYTESGYPYHVISKADPNAKAGEPTLYSLGFEVKVCKQLLAGLQFSNTFSQKISGSNWTGAKNEGKPIPIERFDVEETYSAKSFDGTINYIVIPIDFVHSRWEFSFGAGISYNKLKVSGIQRFKNSGIFTAGDDSSASYKFKSNGFGFLFGGSLDFYWSSFISNQFRLEMRRVSSLEVPAQSLTYVTTRSRVRITDTHNLKKHSIRASGAVLSLSLRFHI